MYGAGNDATDDGDEYARTEIGEHDSASMLAALEQQLDARTLALALGVKKQELDWIRAGREPDERSAERLRLLFEMSRTADLSDPEAVAAAALGMSGLPGPAAGLRLLVRGPYRRALFLFLAFDALLVVGVVAYVLLALR